MRVCCTIATATLSLFMLVTVPLGAQTASGANGEVPRAASAVIGTVMSPYCPGLLLSNCPSPSADSLRRAIVERALGGADEAALRADLVAAYGPGVLAEPPMRGLGIVAWVAPFALLAIAGAGLTIWMRRQRSTRRRDDVGVVAAIPESPDDAAALRRIDELVRGRP